MLASTSKIRFHRSIDIVIEILFESLRVMIPPFTMIERFAPKSYDISSRFHQTNRSADSELMFSNEWESRPKDSLYSNLTESQMLTIRKTFDYHDSYQLLLLDLLQTLDTALLGKKVCEILSDIELYRPRVAAQRRYFSF
jgi:hypothetical protein